MPLTPEQIHRDHLAAADRPATEPRAHLHAYTCAYCTGDGIDRPDFVDREDFEAHMEHLHHGLPFEFPRAEAAQGAAPLDDEALLREIRGAALSDARRLFLARLYEEAAPRAEWLDAERLFRVLWETPTYHRWANDKEPDQERRFRKWAEDIAAEYARLSRPSDERVPHE